MAAANAVSPSVALVSDAFHQGVGALIDPAETKSSMERGKTMSKANLPGFTADDSLCKARGHYQADSRAVNLPTHAMCGISPAMEFIDVRSCPPGFDQVGSGGDGGALVCVQQQGGDGGGSGSGSGGGPGSGPGGGGGSGKPGGGGPGPKKKGNGRDGGNYNPTEGGPCCGGSQFQRGNYQYKDVDGQGNYDWMCCQENACGGCVTRNGKSEFCKDGHCFNVSVAPGLAGSGALLG